MARTYGSKNRRNIPNASEMVKYSAQTLQKALEYLSEVIESDWNDPRFTHAHRLNCIKAQADLLAMAGYGKELEAGSKLIHSKQGETNPYREETQVASPPQPAPDQGQTSPTKSAPVSGFLSRFEARLSIQ